MSENNEALRLADAMLSLDAWNSTGPKVLMEQAAAELRRLRAENESLRADAERYQWFRTHENWRDSGPYDHLYEEALDTAIDAARSKT